MKKTKSPRRVPQPPLEAGQLWRMAEGNLQVGMVGKFLVHYKLGKHNAVRVPHSCNCIKTIEEFLKTKKAVLALPETMRLKEAIATKASLRTKRCLAG